MSLHAAGVLGLDYALTNTGAGRYAVDGVLASLPVPARARELLDLTGRWSRETRARSGCRFGQGTWRRAADTVAPATTRRC